MNSLKKSIMGKYNAEDVDELLQKVRNDYELCLKEQKERILTLREENREKTLVIEKYKKDEKYIINAITKAEETAQSIIAEAEIRALKRIDMAKSEEKKIDMAISDSYQRLCKLTRASEAIYRSVIKVLADFESTSSAAPGLSIKPIKKLY